MYSVLLVLAFDCIQITHQTDQSQSRLLRSVPDEVFEQRIIPMMDVSSTKQLSETAHHLNQLTKDQMDRFEVVANYGEAMRVMNLDLNQFVSEFPHLAPGAKMHHPLHDTFRTTPWMGAVDFRFKQGNVAAMFGDCCVYFLVREFKESVLGESDDRVGSEQFLLAFPLRKGQINGCILMYDRYSHVVEDKEQQRAILRSAFGEKVFKMDGKTWITGQDKRFYKATQEESASGIILCIFLMALFYRYRR